MEPFFRALKHASNHAELDLHLTWQKQCHAHIHIYIYYIYTYAAHRKHTSQPNISYTHTWKWLLIARNSESNPSPSESSEISRELRLRLSHIGGWAQMAARGGRAAGAFTGRRGGLWRPLRGALGLKWESSPIDFGGKDIIYIYIIYIIYT